MKTTSSETAAADEKTIALEAALLEANSLATKVISGDPKVMRAALDFARAFDAVQRKYGKIAR